MIMGKKCVFDHKIIEKHKKKVFCQIIAEKMFISPMLAEKTCFSSDIAFELYIF